MPAQIHVFRCLEDNIGALVHDPASGACAAIDAPEEKAVLAALEETGWTLSDILVTHRHGDHVQGIPGLKQRTGCRVVAPLKAGQQVPAVDAFVREGDTVHVGDLQAHVWETPGHCADHVSYWFAADRALFAGDTLFTLGCGRVLEGSYAAICGRPCSGLPRSPTRPRSIAGTTIPSRMRALRSPQIRRTRR